MVRVLALLLLSLLIAACSPTISPYQGNITATERTAINPSDLPASPIVLDFEDSSGEVRELALLAERPELPGSGLGSLPISFLPSSFLAGPSPYHSKHNQFGPKGDLLKLPALPYRTTVATLHPHESAQAHGTIFYHTSIMMLSAIEGQFLKKMQRKGWNVVAILPTDSFYRLRLPVFQSQKEDPAAAARFLAEEMDRHYLAQAQALAKIRNYLEKERPGWLQNRQVLMGTSAGSFAIPACAALLPRNTFDRFVLLSPGANLLSTFASGAAKVLPNTLNFLNELRRDPPIAIRRFPTNIEYNRWYQEAVRLTKYHPSALASHLPPARTLFLNGTVDRVLPKEEIETIHTALGKPERWTYPLGHHLIAVNLLSQTKQIHRFLLR